MTYPEDMTNGEFEEIVSKLPAEDADKLRQSRKWARAAARKSTIAAIQAKNFSHGVGRHYLRVLSQKE
ncbi:hypothetical protein GW764_00535 [Candidatus Parcubacteria bacterium]|nr:hypothetical protein [Candidatus Parcubacteria bacterium]